jgi:hypothetical protein
MNMGHCRFHNTNADLEDCMEHIDDHNLSGEEKVKRNALIENCVQIALDYGYEVGQEVKEVE